MLPGRGIFERHPQDAGFSWFINETTVSWPPLPRPEPASAAAAEAERVFSAGQFRSPSSRNNLIMSIIKIGTDFVQHYLPTTLSVCLSVCLFLSLSLPVSVCLCLSLCLSLSIYLSISVCLSLYLSVSLFFFSLCLSHPPTQTPT